MSDYELRDWRNFVTHRLSRRAMQHGMCPFLAQTWSFNTKSGALSPTFTAALIDIRLGLLAHVILDEKACEIEVGRCNEGFIESLFCILSNRSRLCKIYNWLKWRGGEEGGWQMHTAVKRGFWSFYRATDDTSTIHQFEVWDGPRSSNLKLRYGLAFKDNNKFVCPCTSSPGGTRK